jgi:hypothetical protein
LNTSITVEIYEDGSLISTVNANSPRPDVGQALGDNGLHGFNIATPLRLQDGNSHTVNVRFESSTTDLTNSPAASFVCQRPPSPDFVGFVEHLGCDSISGWAAARTAIPPTGSVSVQLREGSNLINVYFANLLRPDVAAFLGETGTDAGKHGFSITTPQVLKDGRPHFVQVTFNPPIGGVNNDGNLSGSPVTLTCGTPPPPIFTGSVEHWGCDGITGWAADKNQLNSPINIFLYDGQIPIETIAANQFRADIASLLGDNGLHGFAISIPQSIVDGNPHLLGLRFPGTSLDLPNSPQEVICSPPHPIVIFDLSCGQVIPGSPSVSCDSREFPGTMYDITFPATLSAGDIYKVRLFNIDDHESVYVNGVLAGTADYGQDVTFDITSFMNLGSNTIRLIEVNDAGPWTDGFTVTRFPVGTH